MPDTALNDGKRPRSRRAWPLIKRFWPWMGPHMRYVWIMVVLLGLSTPLALVSPLIIWQVVDDAVERASQEVLTWGIVLVAMTIVSVVLGLGVGYATTMFHNKVLRSVRMRIYLHMQRLAVRFYSEHETGYLMSRQVDDVDKLGGVMADAFGRAAIDAFRAVGYVIMIFYVEWRMATGGLALVAVIFGYEYLISGQLRERSRQAREARTEVSRALHQGISGHKLVQGTASERREGLRFARVLHDFVRKSVRRDMFSLVTNHVFGLIGGVAPTLIVLAGVYLIVTSDFTVGGLFAFFMYLMQLFGAVGSIAGLNPAMQNSLTSLERIYEVLDTTPEIESPEDGRRLPALEGNVCFEQVTFAYEEGRPVLHDVTLDVPARSMVALVGPSGAGKTTLAELVPRFYDPTAGSVLVDGHDLRRLDLRWYRRRIGLVPQEIFLFDRSIADNVAYGVESATPDELRRAARAANALDFIEELPDGFETVIGERGVRLSGGQRQRLAIAREILRNPSVLILDEATSSLDSETEALIQQALETLLEGRTSFVIAHRLSTVIRADVIVVLDGGRIVEQGRHADLLARGGLYARLYESQFMAHQRGAPSERAS